MSYTITNGKVVIETNSDLQRMLNSSSLNNQLIYSSFYCEKIDWIIDYAKKMYNIFKKAIDLSKNNMYDFDEYAAKETINNYYFSGIPYKINMYGNTPEISWQPNCLKQAIDMAFGFANIVVKYFMPKTIKLNMIVVNVETKQMYIKVETKIKQIKNNY